MCNPTFGEIFLGSLAVICSLVLASYAVHFSRSRRNPLWWIVAGGSALFAIGVVGQRAVVLNSVQSGGGCGKTVAAHTNIWDASIGVPLTVVHLSMVSAVGAFIGVLGACLLLFFERVDDEAGSPVAVGPISDALDAN